MARVAGVDLPREKRGEVAVTYIYGLGRSTGRRILLRANVDPSKNPCLGPFNLDAYRASWGFGFRWFSPIGPLRFEWGVPFKTLPGEQPIVFEFTIGNFF